jgi:ribonucleoside-triphosphate reductase
MVEQITRITGYFTKVSSWNKGKIGELKDRYRNPGLGIKEPKV